MKKVEGKEIAASILKELSSYPPPKKFLAVFLVGDNSYSLKFINQKEKIAQKLKIDFRLYRYDKNISNDILREKIRQVVLSKRCGGAILQLPLPKHLNPFYVTNVIPHFKDIEVMSERVIGSFYHRRSLILPPTVAVVEEIFKSLKLTKKSFQKVAILGQGFLVGRPLTNWFLEDVPEVYSFSQGCEFDCLTRADLVILGTGKAGIIKANMLKRGAGVIDFGYGVNEKTGKIEGDFDIGSLSEVDDNYLSFYTPTPNGTGPILIASLFKNFFTLNNSSS